MKKLNEDQTLKFVTLYREHECLWDTACENYRNQYMRGCALKKLCEDIEIEGFTVEDAKHKIKSIRSTYFLELNKIEMSIICRGSDNVYKPKMKWFTKMDSFLKKVMVKRKAQFQDIVNRIKVEPEDNTTAAQTSICSEMESPKPEPKISQLPPGVTSAESLQNNICKVEEDEFDAFGKHVAQQLRKLSTEQGILAQEEIQRVITQCRLDDLSYQQNKVCFAKH